MCFVKSFRLDIYKNLYWLVIATVHLPRIGYATPKFNWYGTERLIRKHLAAKGIPTIMYLIYVL